MKAGLVFVVSSVIMLAFLIIYVSGFVATFYAGNAVSNIKSGNGVEAVNNIEAAKKLSPHVATYPRMKAEYLNLWLNTSPKVRATVEPIISKELKSSLEVNPFYFRHYIKTATILKDLGYYGEAARAYEQAVVLVPNSVKLRNGLATHYIRIEEYDKAQVQLQKGLELTQNDWAYETFYVAAMMYEKQGKREEAISSLLKSLAIAPNSPLCDVIIRQLRSTLNGFDNFYGDKIEECKRLSEV